MCNKQSQSISGLFFNLNWNTCGPIKFIEFNEELRFVASYPSFIANDKQQHSKAAFKQQQTNQKQRILSKQNSNRITLFLAVVVQSIVLNINKWVAQFTVDRSAVFSRNAPTQPVNPMTNATIPQQMRMKAGSNMRLLSLDGCRNESFSFHAHTPTANIHNPASYMCIHHRTNCCRRTHKTTKIPPKRYKEKEHQTNEQNNQTYSTTKFGWKIETVPK